MSCMEEKPHLRQEIACRDDLNDILETLFPCRGLNHEFMMFYKKEILEKMCQNHVKEISRVLDIYMNFGLLIHVQ